MLDFFLVLGQVPGTNFIITFNEIVVFVAMFFLYRYAFTRRETMEKNLRLAIKEPRSFWQLTLLSLQEQQRTLTLYMLEFKWSQLIRRAKP